MPIYEYQSVVPEQGCQKCRIRFEVIQLIDEEPLVECPNCGSKVKRLISWCRANVVESSEEYSRMENQVREYEQQGMWSHAAELADSHAEKAQDSQLKTRALENYKKAGYDVDSTT